MIIENYPIANHAFSSTEPPERPLSVKVGEVWSRAATVSWSSPFDGNSPITQYIVHYWKDIEGKFDYICLFIYTLMKASDNTTPCGFSHSQKKVLFEVSE